VNPQTVQDMLQHAWKFDIPLSFAVVGHHKYLFGVPLQEHVTKILVQGPWNVCGSLLLLQPWSPDLAINEIHLHLCSFWVQVHGLPRQNMAIANSVIIAQRLGKILEVNDLENTGLICRPFLRFRVELDSAQPLIPGFHLPCPSREPLWISFRYERLGEYCTLCGLIGHKKIQCSQPPHCLTPNKYHIPLQTFSLYGIRQTLSPSRDDTDSGVSSVGTSHSHSDARSSPVHGAESSLQLVAHKHFSHPAIHVASSYSSQAMQISSPAVSHPLVMLSSSAELFHEDSYVASPPPFHFLPFDISTQVGESPFTASSRPTSSLSSLAAMYHLESSRLSLVDKGKGPLFFVPPVSSPFPESPPNFSLTNISHPCPITISSPLTQPVHFTDFLARWPQPYSPRPLIHPPPQPSTLGLLPSIQNPPGPSQISFSQTQFTFNSTSTH